MTAVADACPGRGPSVYVLNVEASFRADLITDLKVVVGLTSELMDRLFDHLLNMFLWRLSS